MGDDAYQLIDAGDARRLERFGELIVDRPAPTAEDPHRDPAAWTSADLRFDRYLGWTGVADGGPEPWIVADGPVRIELRPTDTGQVGFFPEQTENRAWIRAAIEERRASPPTVLNLFAYTGVVTLDAANAGASITHVDGSRPTVGWARHNAELSGLEDRPIRWIVDDVEAFVDREIRRGRRYDAVVLDPPSYGHGGRGKGASWRIEDRLPSLLDRCAALTDDDPAFVILSAHTPGFGPDRLADELGTAFGRAGRVERGELELVARSGARLRLGAFARMIRR